MTTFARAMRLVACAATLGLVAPLAAIAGSNEGGEEPFQPRARADVSRAVAPPSSLAAIACPIPAEAAALRDGMLQQVNARRRAAGLGTLRHDPSLERAAAVVACDNAQRGVMDHTARREGGLRERVRAQGYGFRTASEALAYGYRAPDRLANVWYNSSYHYPTLMTPQSQEAGIAIVLSGNGTLWWAMISAQPR